MKCIEKTKLELSDTILPDLFISNYMPGMDEISIKVYLTIKLMAKSYKETDPKSIQKKLGISETEYSKAITELEQDELILKTEEGFMILDIKDIELNKNYIPKLNPKTVRTASSAPQKRMAAAVAINDSFFQGVMSLSWYSDIATLFEKYMFDEDVMIALFHYCQERKALKKNYVFKVAENWYLSGVKTFENLENCLENQEIQNQIKTKIKRGLRLNRNLTEYEEEYINKWITDFKYGFDIIEIALQKTAARTTNPTISYINGILKNWNEKGFTKVEQILEETNKLTKNKVMGTAVRANTATKSLKHKNYEQRKYEDLETYYDNV